MEKQKLPLLQKRRNRKPLRRVKGTKELVPFLFKFCIFVPMEKKVLLFSGGLDSRLQEWLIKPDILLYVDMKTSYSDAELKELRKLSPYYTERLIIKELPLGEYERDNKYLPYRNLILGTIAMQYGQHVYFGFNYKDNAPDKDYMFLDKTTSLFRHLNKNCIGDMEWDNDNFSFNAPFKRYTKSEMMSLCIKNGMPIEDIQSIRSCYDGVSEKGCGKCAVCLNKAVALLNNGIYNDCLFDAPIRIEDLESMSSQAFLDKRGKKHLYEINEAIRRLRQIEE